MISASASLIDMSSDPILSRVLFIASVVLFIAAVIISNIVGKKKNKSGAAILIGGLGMVVAFALSIAGVNGIFSMLKENEANSNTKISNYIHEKYGVTVLNDQNIGAHISNPTTVTLNPIPAKAPNGERIQITIELSQDETDVLAFSSGAEMKKVSEK